MQNVNYEWDVETTEGEGEDEEVLDHDFSDTLAGLFHKGALVLKPGEKLVLVRTDHRWKGREWAYVTEAGLPDHFRDSREALGNKVTKRFLQEYARHKANISAEKISSPPEK